MLVAIMLLFAIMLGESIPWYAPCACGIIALMFHGFVILCISWTHPTKRKERLL